MATRFDITRRDLMKSGAAATLVTLPTPATPPELSGLYRLPTEITLRFHVSHAKQTNLQIPKATKQP